MPDSKNDLPFRWDLQTDEGGLPVHLPMGVTAGGRGPTSDSEAHHYLCWCGNPKCLLNDALRLAWESGTRIIPPAPCCAPDGDEEHCNHHPEWSDAHGCNHPDCKAARPIPPGEPS